MGNVFAMPKPTDLAAGLFIKHAATDEKLNVNPEKLIIKGRMLEPAATAAPEKAPTPTDKKKITEAFGI